MEPLSPSQEIDKALHGELVKLAQPHIARANGALEVLDYDPDNLSQMHDTYCVPGQVVDIEMLDLVGNTVMEKLGGTALASFVEQSDELMTDRRRQLVRKVLQNGQCIYVATTHDNLIDPAMGLGAVTNPLRREKDEQNDFETGIIVNKMLSVLKYKVGEEMIPCMQVLGWLCDRTYLSYPQSESFRNSDAGAVLPEGHVGVHNARIKTEVAEWLAKGGVALGVAPSGATHKWNDEDTECELPEVGKGTGEMMAGDNIRVLALIMGLDSEEPFIQAYRKNLYNVRSWQGSHRVLRGMTGALNKRSHERGDGKPYVYRGGRRLPSGLILPGRH
jgi:hypothetical protein